MFNLLYNFYKYCKKRSERKVTLAVLGLDNAGKTTLMNSIKGEVDEETAPTFGFNSSTLNEGKYILEVFDLGGGKTFRSVWSKYLAEVHGIVYVVDAADPARFEESKKAMTDVLESQYMRDKPVLVFANKQDLPTASAAAQVVDGLGLSTCRNSHNVIPCAAKTPAGAAVDPRLREGIRWLIGVVDREYARLDKRVQAEAEAVRQEEAIKKKERDERVRKQREERARLQREEEARAREVENENALHDGKGAAILPERLQPVQVSEQQQQQQQEQQAQGAGAGVIPAHLGLALGLPHTIESPGKFPPPPAARRQLEVPPPTSDSAASISDQVRQQRPGTGGGGGSSGTPDGAASTSSTSPNGQPNGRGPLPPLAPANATATRSSSSSANSRGSPEDLTAAAAAAATAVMGAGTLTPSSSVPLAARAPGSRPGSAGRGSVGSGGGRSGCASPRRQGTAEGEALVAGPPGAAVEAAEPPGAAGAGGLAAGPLRPRVLPPMSSGGGGGNGGGSSGGASDSAPRGSFSIVHQNKVVPMARGLAAGVPA